MSQTFIAKNLRKGQKLRLRASWYVNNPNSSFGNEKVKITIRGQLRDDKSSIVFHSVNAKRNLNFVGSFPNSQ